MHQLDENSLKLVALQKKLKISVCKSIIDALWMEFNELKNCQDIITFELKECVAAVERLTEETDDRFASIFLDARVNIQ